MTLVNDMTNSTPAAKSRIDIGAILPLLAVILVAIAVPLLVAALWLKVLTSVAIYALTAASIALLYRKLGRVSLAQVAFMGCGG